MKSHWTQDSLCKREEDLDVIWYSISDRSSCCSKVCCIVANPIRRGSRSPTRQLLISTPFFCLGLTSVGLASSNLSFRAPTKTAQRELISSTRKMIEHARDVINGINRLQRTPNYKVKRQTIQSIISYVPA